ncbi:glycosyltransferase family 4 protein [Nonomuraea sp. NPDC003804]|uniref:glycosyltransferase family 4 protein n=1 Tax=Nonomuraea sp. NPDC003804 TaxID=3154547 RepID=UPI0033BD6AFC
MNGSAERPLRIALISPVWQRTPPVAYGATELMVSVLTEELVRRGHDVTLYAPGDAVTKARLRSFLPQAPGWEKSLEDPTLELHHVVHAYRDAGEFDVIHDHTDPFGPAIGAFAAITRPVVHTVHSTPAEEPLRSLYRMIHERVGLVALSAAQRATTPELRYAQVIHHGLPIEEFRFRPRKGDYALFVGRMMNGKGVDLAIRAARKAGLRLLIATKEVQFGYEARYLRDKVKPLLGDDVELVGEVGFEAKVELYGNARCTLVPTNWDEPFGLTVVESLACGTPVVGLRRGATAEIVEHGVTGFLAADVDGLAHFAGRTAAISPAACRRAAEERYSAALMAQRYEALYRRMIAAHEER